ncbi:MAG TPA: hypothetical protein VI815_02935 [Candidatus Nanoarchaeia archaeon]|nr:hypothetical protein [Candidatus Nanoarchaeia archaeon]
MAKQTKNFLKPELQKGGINEASSQHAQNEAGSNLPDSVTLPLTEIQKDIVPQIKPQFDSEDDLSALPETELNKLNLEELKKRVLIGDDLKGSTGFSITPGLLDNTQVKSDDKLKVKGIAGGIEPTEVDNSKLTDEDIKKLSLSKEGINKLNLKNNQAGIIGTMNINDKELIGKQSGPEEIGFRKIGNTLRYIDPVFEAIKKAVVEDQKSRLHSINCLQVNDGPTLIIFQGNRDNVWAYIEARLDVDHRLINRNIKIYNSILRQILKSAEATRGIVNLFN